MRVFTRSLAPAVTLVAVVLATSGRTPAAGPEAKEVRAVLDRAYDALKAKQNPDGSFAPKLGGPGVTALAAAALIRSGRGPDDPVVARALEYLEKNVQKDGGIYSQRLANYTTSVALLAFKEANTSGRYDAVIRRGAAFLKGLQTGDESGDATAPRYGGVGYDGASRPDLSNTHFFLDALQAAGVGKDDPAVKRALVFVSRCQNLPGEHNDQAFARKATADDKGGLTYNPLDADSERNPNRTPEGGLRSAGSMTYAGLKSFLYAGLSKDDPRVKAALDWIGRHYSLEENPGQRDAGLYYYYHLFAKAMDALGQDEFTDARGVKHDWRQELFEALKKRQRPDGSWTNSNRAFMENSPELATAFAVLSLSYCQPRAK